MDFAKLEEIIRRLRWDSTVIDFVDSSEIIVRGKKAKKYAKWFNKNLKEDILQTFPVVVSKQRPDRIVGEEK
jgi:hypothetical protein